MKKLVQILLVAAAISFWGCVADSTTSAEILSSSSTIVAVSSSSSLATLVYGSTKDPRDGQVYKTVVIGQQNWMAQNLNYSGDNGMGGRTYTIGWCYGVGATDTTQHRDSTTCNTYGRSYRWTDAMNIAYGYSKVLWGNGDTIEHTGLCPIGWHVPSVTDWNTLAFQIDGAKGVANGAEGQFLKTVLAVDAMNWNEKYNAQNPYGFSALPAGYRDTLGNWKDLNGSVYFRTASEVGAVNTGDFVMYYSSSYFDEVNFGKNNAMSLRCLQN